MSKIIIENLSKLSDVEALKVVGMVISAGLISTKTIQGEKVAQYCDLTHITDRVTGIKCVVWARPRKTKESAYSFLVYDEEEMNEHE
jgi:hypothetical protein